MADYLGYERAFKNFGINYTVEPGAYNRGHGDLKEVRFIVIHHTASANNDASGIVPVRDGVSGLKGPLSQLCLKRNGDPHLIAVGVCWHAYGEINYRGVPAGSGNYYSIGIEGIDGGYNTWTEAQRANYPRVVAALLKDMNLPSDAFIFHREYQPKTKIDPGGFTRDWFQAEVNRHYNSGGKPIVTKSAIQIKRDANAWLGDKLFAEDERITPDKIGRYAHYENGSIYWTPALGAKVLSSEMMTKWASTGYEVGFLGYPTTDVADLPVKEQGRYAHFQNGSIYWSEKYGARILNGEIKKRWAGLDWERSFLGMPKSDEIPLPDKVGVLQDFEGGIIYHSPSTGSHPIGGLILEAFRKNDYEKATGYPLGGEIKCPTEDGVFQIFEFAHVYYKHGAVKAFVVDNDVLEYYGRMGYESGRLNFPIGNKFLVKDNIWRQDFIGGSIEIGRNTKSAILIINGESISV